MTPKTKAIELVKALHKDMEYLDTYWNITEDAKRYAKTAILQIVDFTETTSKFYWQEVLKEIDLLPEYVENIKD